MADRKKPHNINIQSTTKAGECKINICLELNINVNGGVEVTAQNVVPVPPKQEAKEIKDTTFMIPDFTSGQMIDFGK